MLIQKLLPTFIVKLNFMNRNHLWNDLPMHVFVTGSQKPLSPNPYRRRHSRYGFTLLSCPQVYTGKKLRLTKTILSINLPFQILGKYNTFTFSLCVTNIFFISIQSITFRVTTTFWNLISIKHTLLISTIVLRDILKNR